MNKISKIEMYIDDETGVILSEKMNTVKEPKFRFKHKNNRFTKVWCMEDVEFSNSSYYKYLYKIQKTLEVGTNRLVKHGSCLDNNIGLSRNNLIELLEISKRTFDDFIRECRFKDILKFSKGYIYMNPVVALNGGYIKLETYLMFKSDSLTRLIMSNCVNVKFDKLTNNPGIYIMKDINNNILYIGKSKNINTRIGQHLSGEKDWIVNIKTIDAIEIKNLQDMDFYEVYLIAKNKPKHNVDCNRKNYDLTVNIKELNVTKTFKFEDGWE